MASTTTTKMMQANEACVITVGARAPVYEKAIVRDRHTGKLAEVDMNPERPPVAEGDLGRSYVFKRDEKVRADHEAVLDAPGCFREADD
jgi:hypothetical protein